MPADISLTGSLNGLSTVGGAVGPASFSYSLTAEEKYHTQELSVAVATGAPVVHTLPTLTSQTLFYLKTTADVILTVNAEPSGTLLAGGVYTRAGMVNVTSITLDGNGTTAGSVFVVVVGS